LEDPRQCAILAHKLPLVSIVNQPSLPQRPISSWIRLAVTHPALPGWNEDDLRARRNGHRTKVMLARRIREETTMSLKWITQR
jgi:hypothetical protein